MRQCYDEFTLDELLADPLIGDVMRADGVDPEQLGADLSRMMHLRPLPLWERAAPRLQRVRSGLRP